MTFQPVDHIPDIEFGYWKDLYTLWHNQGMPKIEANDRAFELYFGLEQWMNYVPVKIFIHRLADEKLVEVKDGYEYFYNTELVYCRRPSDRHDTVPQYLEYPLKTEKDWIEKFLPYMNPDDGEVIPDNLEESVQELLNQNEIITIHVGSLFGQLRDWIGFEQIALMVYDNPKLLERIIEDTTNFTCTVLEKVLPHVGTKIVHAHFWEDICFNKGPMISPEYFRRVLTPRYKRITDILHKYGINIISVDCDGRIHELVDHWLEGGVNTMFPLEQNGQCDVAEFRRRYGRDLLMIGGVDKIKISAGGDIIKRELERIAPIVEEGGFIPCCDHRCPADVSLENYRHYLKLKREIFGIPQKEEKPRESTIDIV